MNIQKDFNFHFAFFFSPRNIFFTFSKDKFQLHFFKGRQGDRFTFFFQITIERTVCEKITYFFVFHFNLSFFLRFSKIVFSFFYSLIVCMSVIVVVLCSSIVIWGDGKLHVFFFLWDNIVSEIFMSIYCSGISFCYRYVFVCSCRKKSDFFHVCSQKLVKVFIRVIVLYLNYLIDTKTNQFQSNI